MANTRLSSGLSPEYTRQMKESARLAMPKRVAVDSRPFGYSIQERLKEMRQILRIKEERLKRLQIISRDHQDLQEGVIGMLRKEINVKANILYIAGNIEKQILYDVLKDDKRERLALHNGNIEGALEALEEWFAFQKNVLNLAKYVHRQTEQDFLETKREMEYLDYISVSPDEAEVKKVVRRYENNIARLKTRLETAQRLRRSYQEIFDKYQEESLTLSQTLENVEKAVRMHRMELNDLLEMRHELEISLKETQRQLHHTEQSVQAASEERKQIEAMTRKKDRDQTRVDKLLVKMRRLTIEAKMSNSVTGAIALAEEEKESNTQQLLNYTIDFDTMKSQMSANNFFELLEALVKQSSVGGDLKELTHQREKERSRLRAELGKLKAVRQKMKEDEHGISYRGKKVEEEMKRKIATAEREKERISERLDATADVLHQLARGVSSIYQRLLQMNEVKLISLTMDDGAVDEDGDMDEGSAVASQMRRCQLFLRELVDQAVTNERGSAVTLEMTKCSLFGRIISDRLDLLMPSSAKRPVKLESEILKGIEDIEISRADDVVVLTREEMKKQHKRFYDQRKNDHTTVNRVPIV